VSIESRPQIAEIYNLWIEEQNRINVEERYSGEEKYFGASGTNMCYRKNFFRRNKVEPTDQSDITSSRKMRLGTIQHTDYELALNWFLKLKNGDFDYSIYNNTISSINSSIETIVTEGEVIIPEINVRGFYDAVFVMTTGEVYLYDFKTIASYPYKLKFGRNPKPAKIPTHEVQLATYGIAVEKEFGRLDGMFLYYYNKDTSGCKTLEVEKHFMDEAREYWERANEICTGELPPPLRVGESPMHPTWECGYCNYQTHCQEN